jgi:UDP-N-acetylglucosamine 3-dehydrogenase
MKGRPGVGVIGVGAFGSRHAELYSQLELCDLIGVADIRDQRLDEVCPALGVEGYSDYRELLKRDDIDAVSICTTDELHVDVAVAAARAGKHILVEKPLALTPEDCDEIITACTSAGVVLTVGHILRFDPRYHAARQEIASGRVGELVHVHVRRNNPVRNARRLAQHTTVLFFLGIHDLDFVNWCVGARAERVYAEATSRVLGGSPDTVLAVIRYSNGVIASLEASWVLPDAYPGRLDARFEAIGTQGALYVNGGSETVTVVGEDVVQPELYYAPEVYGERVGILRDELVHFVQCVVHGGDPAVSGQDGKAAVKLACAIQEAYESSHVVTLE